jgi:hypothetical protein
VVHRQDKPLKFRLHNSCTNAPKQWVLVLVQEWGIVSECNLLIPNNNVWNREFAKPLHVAKRALWVWIQSVRHVRLAHLGAHSFPRMRLTSRLPCRIRIMCMASASRE